MLKDIQQLKIADLKQQVAKMQNKKHLLENPVSELQDQIYSLENRLSRGKHAYRGKQTFNKWEQLISCRAEYKKYQTWLQDFQSIPSQIEKIKQQIETAKQAIAVENASLQQEIAQLESEIFRVERAVTLFELGIKPHEAVEMLERNHITPVLDESDRTIYEHKRNYQSKEDLITVHKMHAMPTNNRLSTLHELGLQKTETITIDGKEYEYSYELERNTIHVSMNDEVSSHLGGNWDSCKYTVLQPFAEINHEQVASAVANDTYTRGGIDLTKHAWILCPAHEVDEVKKQNPQVHVLGYQGENSMGLAAPFLSQLGYRAEQVGQWGWEDYQSQEAYNTLMQRENFKLVQHCDTTDIQDEEFLISANKLVGIMKMLKDNNLVQSVADYQRIKPQLEVKDYGQILKNVTLSKTNVFEQETIDPTAIVANGKQMTVLAKKMQQAGMPFSKTEFGLMQAKLEDHINHTDHVQQAGCQLLHFEIIERAMVNSMARSCANEQQVNLDDKAVK